VWRAKWLVPEDQSCSYLVLACMHGGCRVSRLQLTHVDLEDSWQAVEESHAQHVDSRNPQHLAYGIDVLSCAPVMSDQNDATHLHRLDLASCSFYDNLIQRWSCTL
jgi:hypothetical protein